MKFKIYIILLFVITICNYTYSQNQKANNFYYRLFTVEQGLSTSSIFSLLQDKKGNLWIGTIGAGVNVYNGVTFKNITKENGLVGINVYSMLQDKSGCIWVSTEKGISKINNNNNNNITNYTFDNGLPDNIVWKVFQDHSGKIWAGTNKGLAFFNKNKFEPFNCDVNLDKQAVWTIFEDSKNNLWVGTKTQGVFKISGKNIIQYSTKNKLSNNWVFSINEDHSKNIYVCTSIGLNLIKDSVFVFPSTPSYTASSELPNGRLIFITYSGKVTFINSKKNDLNTLYSTPDFNYRASLVDNEGNIWIGTETGLIQIPPSPFINYNEDQGLNNNVYAVSKGYNKNELWIGCAKNGAYYFKENDANNRFYNFQSIKSIESKLIQEKKLNKNKLKKIVKKNLNSNVATSITKDNNNRTWIGTYNGISIFNPTDSSFIHITNDTLEKKYGCIINKKLRNKGINFLTKDNKGNIWCGTQTGINVFQDTSIIDNNTELQKLNSISIYHIFQDIKQIYWISTQQGLYSYNGKILYHIKANSVLEKEQINSIIQDKRNNYWVATKEGLIFYNLTDAIKIDNTNGLISNTVYSLTLDKTGNFLFIGTNQGLDKLNITNYYKKNKIEITHFSKFEGFLGLDCNRNAIYLDSIGRIWIGTVNGITMYNPRLDKINNIKPNTYITNILYNFKKYDWSPYCDKIDSATGLPVNLSIPYNKNYITFQFAANSLIAPEKVMYKFMMKGYNDNWLPALHKNEADFPTLPPGKYTFKVKACNNDGIWNETPTEFSFEILPPWYLTWYFIVGSIIVVLILIFAFIKYREAALRRDKIRLEKTVVERTVEVVKQKEIVEQKNKDITDSINYAKNIQEAVLPTKDEITSFFPESFMLYKPRDIVSGDFYWISNHNNKTYFAVADCTGHGVPGAFMSMLGIAFLDEIVNSNTELTADNILNQLRENVILSLRQTGRQSESKDGMDISLIVVNWKESEIEYAGANNPIYIARRVNPNIELLEFKADSMPIGFHIKKQPFNKNIVKIEKEDSLYMFSDGYADQFGGPHNKKFKYKQLKELLVKINNLPMQEQKLVLESTIINWRGNNFQVDDVILSGIFFGSKTFTQNLK